MATPEVEEDGSSTGENPWTGVKKTPMPNGVPKSAGSMEGVGAEPRTTGSGTGGGAGTTGTALDGPHGGWQQMGDGARSTDVGSLPEFCTTTTSGSG
ncbi:hypothetical protein ZWY2020_039788 [Hordeum vulgare]|nr:hypothetical protein ZWY2020_039788 [Hordeum vulgare]